MQLHTLELYNFCNHRERIIDFQPGLTVIIGANGVGKSDCFGAVRLNLTGRSHKPGTLAANICDRAPKSENSFTRLSFSHAGVSARVTRNLRPAHPTATLELSTGEVVEGAEKVKERVLQILGVTDEIINDIVLVAQDDLFGFLDQQPSKRKEAFQRLFGLQRAETIYGDCTTALGQIEIPTITVDMDELRINVRQKEEQARTLQDQINQQPTVQQITEGTAENQKVVDHFATRSRLSAEIATQQQRLAPMGSQLVTASESLETLKLNAGTIESAMTSNAAAAAEADKILSNLSVWKANNALRRQTHDDLAGAELRLAALTAPTPPENYVADANQRKVVQQRRDQIQREIGQLDFLIQRGNAVVRPPHPGDKPANYVHDRTTWQQEHDSLTAIIDSYKRLLKSVEGEKACCDGCGTPVTTLQGKIAEAQANLPACKARAQELFQAREATEDYDNRLAHHERNMATVREGEEAAAKKQPLVEELQRINAAIEAAVAFDREYHSYLTNHGLMTEAVARLRTSVASLPPEVDLTAYDETTLQSATQSQQTYSDGLAELRQLAAVPLYTQEQRDHAQRNIDWWAAAKVRRETLVVQLQAAQEAHAEVVKRLADNEAVVARSQRMREWRGYLEKVRSGFHKDAAPRRCSLRQLQNLEAVVNEHLAMMQADFRVTPSDDLSFIAHFNSGTKQPASRLSGGQRVLLVFAVRLALSAMFAGTLGLLGLDEPTAYLDEHHIRGFEPAIDKLKEYSAATGLQCVIITHERSLAPLFDHVINLSD